MKKLIRECRMGRPKTFKTGAILGSYPKPILHLSFDQGGVDVIPKSTDVITTPGYIKPDVSYEEVTHLKPGQIGTTLATPFSKIVSIDYTISETMAIDLALTPAKASQPFTNFVNDYETLRSFIGGKKAQGQELPWKTVCFDGITGFEQIVLNHISSANPGALADARQWASMVGGKVRQAILSLTTWPCHVVVLMHSNLDVNELNKVISETPNVYSALRNDISGMFSQFFYSCVNFAGQPKIWTGAKDYVTGIGPRWPLGLPQECAPDFHSIYGKEGL